MNREVAEKMAIFGGGMALHHRLNYGSWYDKDEDICHGKAGLFLLLIGLLYLFGQPASDN